MKKIIGYLLTWLYYRFGQFINYMNYEFDEAFAILNLLNPFTDIMMYTYIICMEKSMIIQEWSKLNKPWQIQ